MSHNIPEHLRTQALEQAVLRLKSQGGLSATVLQSAAVTQFEDSVQRVVSAHADWMRTKVPPLVLSSPVSVPSSLSPERQARLAANRAVRQQEASMYLSGVAEMHARSHQVRLMQFFTLIGITEALSDRLVTALIADS